MIAALQSATFHQPGSAHTIEIIHQERPGIALRSLTITTYDETGACVRHALAAPRSGLIEIEDHRRLMIVFEAEYDPEDFGGYRPHHYGWLRTEGGIPLYYALTAVRGGPTNRIAPTRLWDHEHYDFMLGLDFPRGLLLGNPAASAGASVRVRWAGGASTVLIPPGGQREIGLPPTTTWVELSMSHRIASYVWMKDAEGRLTVFDHLFNPTRGGPRTPAKEPAVTARAPETPSSGPVICHCVGLRQGALVGDWRAQFPLAGRLCTGCRGDLALLA